MPCLQRRQIVCNRVVRVIPPFQSAYQTLKDKNVDILQSIITVKDSMDHNCSDLSMKLSGVLDAAVNGAIDKYVEAFFEGRDDTGRKYLQEFPEQTYLAQKFKDVLKE